MNERERAIALSMPGGLKLIEALKARLGTKASLGMASTYLKDFEAMKDAKRTKAFKQLGLIDSEDV